MTTNQQQLGYLKNQTMHLDTMRSSRANYNFKARNNIVSTKPTNDENSEVFNSFQTSFPFQVKSFEESETKATITNLNEKLEFQSNYIQKPAEESDKENSSLNSNLNSKPLFSSGKKSNKSNLKKFPNLAKQNTEEGISILKQNLLPEITGKNEKMSKNFLKSKEFLESSIADDKPTQENMPLQNQEYSHRKFSKVILPTEDEGLNSQLSTATKEGSLIEGMNKTHIDSKRYQLPLNEMYKILTMKNSRKVQFKDNKSTSRYETNYKSERRPDFDNIMEVDTSTGRNLFEKRKKIVSHSVKKEYFSNITFKNPENNEEKAFKIFKDCDIGFSSHWQKYLKETKEDEDVPSDEDLLRRATRFNHEQLWEAFNLVKENQIPCLVHNAIYTHDK